MDCCVNLGVDRCADKLIPYVFCILPHSSFLPHTVNTHRSFFVLRATGVA